MPSADRGYACSCCKTPLCDECSYSDLRAVLCTKAKPDPLRSKNVKELVMSHFDTYRDSFPNARLTRSKTGVLEVALHTNGGTLAFNGYTHEQFVDLFHAVGSDRD